MIALFNWRLWAAIAFTVALAASHWKAYHLGGASGREALAVLNLRMANEALQASEANRAKEQELKLSNERISHALAKEKAARAADGVATADKLRDLQTALDSIADADTSATGRTDDPALTVARQCASSLVLLDEYAAGLASQTRGLQSYAREVCVSAGSGK